VQKAIKALAQTRTTLIIAHRLSTVKDADKIVVFTKTHRVADQGTHQELLGRSDAYKALVRRQLGGGGGSGNGNGNVSGVGLDGSGRETDQAWAAVRAGGGGGGVAEVVDRIAPGQHRIALAELQGMTVTERETAAMTGAMRVLV
jgi:hypothetical protein